MYSIKYAYGIEHEYEVILAYIARFFNNVSLDIGNSLTADVFVATTWY